MIFSRPPFLQAEDYFVVTPFDTVDIAADAANPSDYPLVALFVGASQVTDEHILYNNLTI